MQTKTIALTSILIGLLTFSLRAAAFDCQYIPTGSLPSAVALTNTESTDSVSLNGDMITINGQ
jgi:hypothetical protein